MNRRPLISELRLRRILESARVAGDRFAASTMQNAIAVLSPSRARTPQAEIAARLLESGVAFRTEVRLPSKSPRSRSGFFRADIAVFHGGRAVALCECKARKRELRGRQR